MSYPDGIRIDFGGIEQKLAANQFEEVRIDLVPDRPADPVLLRALTDAVREADAQQPDTWGEDPLASVDGLSVRVKDLASEESLRAWLAVLVGHLPGVTGQISATPTVRMPREFTGVTIPRMSAFIAYAQPVDSGLCAYAVEWASRAGGQAYLTSGGMQQVDATTRTAEHLELALQASPSAAVSNVNGDRCTHVRLSRTGLAVFQIHDAASEPLDHLDLMRRTLLWTPQRTRLAFVALPAQWAYGWDVRGRAEPPLPFLDPRLLLTDTPQWDAFVPDAHGMQLVTPEHLANAGDLSGWRITDVGGRSLVEAADPAGWFTPPGPSPATVESARSAFGGAIADVMNL